MNDQTDRPSGASTEPPDADFDAGISVAWATMQNDVLHPDMGFSASVEDLFRVGRHNVEAAYEAKIAALRAGAASTEATERPDLRAAFDLMSSEWEEYVNLPTLPEESHDIPWPIRNFVRRARAALTGASPSEPSRVRHTEGQGEVCDESCPVWQENERLWRELHPPTTEDPTNG